MEARASAKYLRGSSQKARLVIDMIRGKNVNQALAILRYSNKRAAAGIEKCVKSAIANANEAAEKANIAVDPDDLWLRAAYVDRGPTKGRRRVRPAPQGRAYRERRHFCHVTILLSSDKPDGTGKAGETGPSVSSKAKRGGAAAAPRAKRTAVKEDSEKEAATPVVEAGTDEKTGEKQARTGAVKKRPAKKSAAKSEAKKKETKTAAKPGKAAGRKKSEK
jgi:large subunit ribosomal protein L22